MSEPLRLLVLHGPNLNLLGRRETAIYGVQSLDEVDAAVSECARARGAEALCEQTNHEGVLIERLHAAALEGFAGVVLNAAALAHTSLAVADAVAAIAPVPVVEVHLTNTAARGELRAQTVVGAQCAGRIEGFGPRSYTLAVTALLDLIEAAS